MGQIFRDLFEMVVLLCILAYISLYSVALYIDINETQISTKTESLLVSVIFVMLVLLYFRFVIFLQDIELSLNKLLFFYKRKKLSEMLKNRKLSKEEKDILKMLKNTQLSDNEKRVFIYISKDFNKESLEEIINNCVEYKLGLFYIFQQKRIIKSKEKELRRKQIMKVLFTKTSSFFIPKFNN